MIFNTNEEVIAYIQVNQKISKPIEDARAAHKELVALLNGKGFAEELINQIEHLESSQKAEARKKYSRSVVDMFERLLQPVDNVFSAHGGIKKYDIKSSEIKKKFLKGIGNIREDKSIESFVKKYWMQVYHTDPAGVVFMEYKQGDPFPLPTLKSIDSIRNYTAKGQKLEVIIFERIVGDNATFWRVVDDAKDYTVKQVGEHFEVVEDKTFEHPFGTVPGIINSDIYDITTKQYLSPINKVVPIAKEYARDQSIKTIYKFQNGFPINWRYVSQCRHCTGTGKEGTKACVECDGHGYYKRKDVTDMVTLPVPDKDGMKIAPDIAGFISPDLDTWTKYTDELIFLENKISDTHWGTHVEKANNETATGRWIDVQPVINKLNQYSDAAQYVEWKITEFLANYIDASKNKSEPISLIVYGRRFIIESPDTILKLYEEEKKNGASSVILDRIFEEYLTSKYKNDPEWLRFELIKSKVEPYLHLSVKEVNEIFGNKEAQKKVYFQKWWGKQNIGTQTDVEIEKMFEADYKQFIESQTINQ